MKIDDSEVNNFSCICYTRTHVYQLKRCSFHPPNPYTAEPDGFILSVGSNILTHCVNKLKLLLQFRAVERSVSEFRSSQAK